MRLSSFVLVASLLALTPRLWATEEPTAEQVQFFEAKVRPLLVRHCFSCHSADAKKLRAGLKLDSRASLLRGGESGPVLTPDKPSESLLLQAVRYQDLKMPPAAPLSAAEVKTLEDWVAQGAPWPPASTRSAEVSSSDPDYARWRREHWAFQPIKKSAVPHLPNEPWVSNDIDRFVLAKLKEQGLEPSATADRATLIRRVYFDLIGLPPTPEQVAAYVSGRQTWEQVIDMLLDSPQYGARWGRHWLDVARFSDGFGAAFDTGRFEAAWRYRDWVVQALNDDMPYDRFVRLQLAGDLLDPDRHAVATGFIALGPQYGDDGGVAQSIAIAKSETLDNRVDTLGRGLLGLTLACARCHDHKFDPIPTLDYYSIAGVFDNSVVKEFPLVPPQQVEEYNAKVQALKALQQENSVELGKAADELRSRELGRLKDYALAALEYQKLPAPRPVPEKWGRERGLMGEPFRASMSFFAGAKNTTPLAEADPWFADRSPQAAEQLQKFVLANRDDKKVREFVSRAFPVVGKLCLDDLPADRAAPLWERLKQERDLLATQPAKYPVAHALAEKGSGNMKVALRGNLLNPGPEAPRRFLRILDDRQTPFTRGSGRLELADALVAPENPLTARVIVNRVWGWHFGQALVRTPSNFGKLGETPSHPELLDWLAATFVEKGWSLKDLHRRILTSNTWKQSSRFDAAKFAKDGDNRFLWRMNSRRLEAEELRDAILAVSGKLDLTLGGQPFDNPETDFRRTIHARTSRNGDKFPVDRFLRLFDFPVPVNSIAQRTPAITPQQALFLLNNPFMIDQSKAVAARLEKEEPSRRVALAYRLLFAREPLPTELDVGNRYLEGKDAAAGPPTRLQRYAQALICSGEFLFIE